MRNPIRRSLTQWVACVLLLSAGQAMAGDEPQPSPSPASAADVDRHPKPYIDHELSDAEKAALVKRRMNSCRLHPGSCEQGAKHKKPRSKPSEQTRPPEKVDQ